MQVLVAIGGRVCACAVTGVPEERFHPGAEDPASDEAPLFSVAEPGEGALEVWEKHGKLEVT